MRRLLLILICFCGCGAQAQDKLFFSDGSIQQGIIVSVAKDVVYFKLNDTADVQKISKTKLVMAENYRGLRYIFGAAPAHKTDSAIKPGGCRRNLLGAQPFGILTGRATLVYERFSANDKIGWAIPLSLTFDPFGSLYKSSIDTSSNAPKRISGVNGIIGLDVNFYMGQSERSKFFIGPRLRYGTDLFLRGTEGYSLQTQFGWRFGGCNQLFTQHLSMGFGFVRILASPLGLLNPRQSYSWFSINYRLGIRW